MTHVGGSDVDRAAWQAKVRDRLGLHAEVDHRVADDVAAGAFAPGVRRRRWLQRRRVDAWRVGQCCGRRDSERGPDQDQARQDAMHTHWDSLLGDWWRLVLISR